MKRLRGSFVLQPDTVKQDVLFIIGQDATGEIGISAPGIYLYAPKDEKMRSDVVVGKTSGYPNQYIIGPVRSVRHIANALNMLDGMFPHGKHRMMNVIISVFYDWKTQKYGVWNDGRPFTSELLDQFGILRSLRGTRYKLKNEGDFGIFNDIRRPLFLSPDYSGLESYGLSPQTIALYWASVILHEECHIEQLRAGLPYYSLWAERHAMSEAARFIQRVLTSTILPTYDRKYTESLVTHLSQRIYNYRNGRGFHLQEKHLQGDPMQHQTLHREDFSLG